MKEGVMGAKKKQDEQRERNEALQAQVADLNRKVAAAIEKDVSLSAERDALKREVGRLKRVVKALRDAFIAATEEDAPTAIPFGGR